MSYLDEIITGDLEPGRYRLARPVGVRVLYDELSAAGWTMRVVDGAEMTDPASLFDEFAVACGFPDWFGGNWDAFVDCLRDLTWLPPRPIAILWQRSGVFATADPGTWRTAGQVIDTAIADRVSIGVPALYVLYPAATDVSGGGGPMLSPVR